jgi:hypothetical protein
MYDNNLENATRFTGRCLVFTKGISPDYAKTTAVHELAHCLGMGHICGNLDRHASASAFREWWNGTGPEPSPLPLPCVMNYEDAFILDTGDPDAPRNFTSAREPFPWSSECGGPDFCAEHLKAMRRAQLHIDATGAGNCGINLGWHN